MLGLCPISGRPIAGELLAPRGGRRPWHTGQADYWAMLAARATQENAARASSILAARAAEDAEEDGDPQGTPEPDDSYPAPRPAMISFGFCGCCCHYTRDRFEAGEIYAAKWSIIEGQWEVSDGALRTDSPNARINLRHTHPDNELRYYAEAKVTADEADDVVWMTASDDAVRAELRFASDGYDGLAILWLNDVCQGAASIEGLVAGAEATFGLCCDLGDEETDPVIAMWVNAACVLSVRAEVTSSKVAIGTGDIAGTAAFGECRVNYLDADRRGCSVCGPSCDVLRHSLNAESVDDLGPCITASGACSLADGELTCSDGAQVRIQDIDPGYSGAFHLAIEVACKTVGDRIRLTINDGEAWFEVEFGEGYYTSRLRAQVVGQPFVDGYFSAIWPPESWVTLSFFICCDGEHLRLGATGSAVALRHVTTIRNAVCETTTTATVKVKSVAVTRQPVDVPSCAGCPDVSVFCGNCDQEPPPPEFLLATLPGLGEFVLQRSMAIACLWLYSDPGPPLRQVGFGISHSGYIHIDTMHVGGYYSLVWSNTLEESPPFLCRDMLDEGIALPFEAGSPEPFADATIESL